MSNSLSDLPVSNDVELLNNDNAGGQHSDGAPRSIIDGLSNYDNHDAEEQDVRPSLKKFSRTQSPIWELFIDAADPHNAKLNVCKHCKTLVNYHKKSESVKVHLNNCAAFRKVMNNMEDDERPEWYRRNKKGATRPVPLAKNARSVSGVSSSLQSSIKQYALSVVSKTQKAKFQKHMALHYYTTGTSFQRVEDLHLKNAICALHPNESLLLSHKQLSSTLMDKCHVELLSKVNLRNALATRTIEKLIFIKSNLNAFYDYPAPDDNIVQYSSESDNDAAATLDDSTP